MTTPLPSTPARRSFPIAWVSIDDLLDYCPSASEEIAQFTEQDLEYIAGKIGDALQETYWTAIEGVLNSYFNISKCVDGEDSSTTKQSDN